MTAAMAMLSKIKPLKLVCISSNITTLTLNIFHEIYVFQNILSSQYVLVPILGVEHNFFPSLIP